MRDLRTPTLQQSGRIGVRTDRGNYRIGRRRVKTPDPSHPTKAPAPPRPAKDGHYQPHLNAEGICECSCRRCFDNSRPIGEKNTCAHDKATPAIRRKLQVAGLI